MNPIIAMGNSKQNSKKSNNKKYEYKGQEYTIPELSRMTGINASTIRSRLKAGWNIYKALEGGAKKTGNKELYKYSRSVMAKADKPGCERG